MTTQSSVCVCVCGFVCMRAHAHAQALEFLWCLTLEMVTKISFLKLLVCFLNIRDKGPDLLVILSYFPVG